MIRSILLALPLIAVAQAASASRIIDPLSQEAVFLPKPQVIPNPAPLADPLWDSVLTAQDPAVPAPNAAVRGSQIENPIICSLREVGSEVIGSCEPANPVARPGPAAGQVPTPGALLLIMAAFGFLWRQQQTKPEFARVHNASIAHRFPEHYGARSAMTGRH